MFDEAVKISIYLLTHTTVMMIDLNKYKNDVYEICANEAMLTAYVKKMVHISNIDVSVCHFRRNFTHCRGHVGGVCLLNGERTV